MMNKVVYLSLGDIVSLENDTWYPNTSNDIVISTIMTSYGLVIEDTSASKLSILTQLMRIIFARFYDCDIYKKVIGLYENDNVAPSSDERKEIWRRFINQFNITAPRFIPLLEQYKLNESDPIAKLRSESTGQTRFNDTPQDEGDFANDSHTTNITETIASTESDSGSIVERLDALYKNWRSILLEWSNEFKCLFYIGGR